MRSRPEQRAHAAPFPLLRAPGVPHVHPWPDFFIVGAPRCGTTSLYHYLSSHPDTHLPWLKEPHFFNGDQFYFPAEAPRYEAARSVEAYLGMYSGRRADARTCDATATYLADPEVPARIRAVAPDAKIVVMVRNPVERAHSHYLFKRRFRLEGRTFSDAIRSEGTPGFVPSGFNVYVDHGFYFRYLQRYLAAFPAEQVAVFLTDELERNPQEQLARICQFVGLAPDRLGRLPSRHYLRSREARLEPLRRVTRVVARTVLAGARRTPAGDLVRRLLFGNLAERVEEALFTRVGNRPTMSPDDAGYLLGRFHDDVLRLQDYLKLDLNDWLRLPDHGSV